MQLEKIQSILKDDLGQRRSHVWKDMGNKYYHGQRTAKLAVALRKRLFPELDGEDELLTVAAWYHDILNGEEHHCSRGAVRTRELLDGLASQEEIDRIAGIIAVHDDRDRPYDPIIQIHQDADLLDHFGAYDIMLTASYGILKGETAEQLRDRYVRGREDEIAEHRPLLRYELSRQIFDERQEFQRRFAEQLTRELDCVL